MKNFFKIWLSLLRFIFTVILPLFLAAVIVSFCSNWAAQYGLIYGIITGVFLVSVVAAAFQAILEYIRES